MRIHISILASLLGATACLQSSAQTFFIEPDNFPNGTVLDHVLPQVGLTTAGLDNLPIPPVSFPVTATYDSFHFASTGTNVFGQAGVQFWNANRRLRLDFVAPASFISIDFIGGDLFTNDIAELDAFNSAGTLLGSAVSNPQGPGSVEALKLSRPAGDIAWAVAYAPTGDGNFIRLDNLQFMVVPEPSVVEFALLGALAWFGKQGVIGFQALDFSNRRSMRRSGMNQSRATRT